MKRKVKTYRKKLALLTDLQHRRSIRYSLYMRACGPLAMAMFSYVRGWE